ncbi:GNAT family N-acetyltransferase [Albidovulum sediminicola]|uniref:GNAT family N-acetyltransferase n=1 Tax=Albidovulum sediminicola TaxID=2984331 RepID=A0ABT2YYI8_9RHOB|nr:GNAT family N-acetyltransferase [Defluviimonas sp. WL0075]MCV2863949.1 GNAT family N-acetyltransferase [Defluviimonas sp. WL0075]
MNIAGDGLILRELSGVAELKASEAFQRTVWGEDDPADNSDLMLAIAHEGGLVAGAFKDGRMLGFLFGFPTRDPKVQHSHRLAVHPDSRGMGLGLKLKWFQRDWCLARGITLVRWTYDPLRRINAGLNITRLGATAGTYYTDYYGKMEGINAGVASDRLLAEWHLTAPGVQRRAEAPEASMDLPETPLTRRVMIPEDFGALLSNDLPRAVSERLRVRAALTSAFDEGYRITGFDMKTREYLLTPPG